MLGMGPPPEFVTNLPEMFNDDLALRLVEFEPHVFGYGLPKADKIRKRANHRIKAVFIFPDCSYDIIKVNINLYFMNEISRH